MPRPLPLQRPVYGYPILRAEPQPSPPIVVPLGMPVVQCY